MNKAELAAHLFRITQTELRIDTKGITGQRSLERTAEEVGKEVRQTMEKSGNRPEDLPIGPHIRDVKKQLKGTNKKLQQIDHKKGGGKKQRPRGASSR